MPAVSAVRHLRSVHGRPWHARLFLYRNVLKAPIGPIARLVRAWTPAKLPVVLSRAEVAAILNQLEGTGGSSAPSCTEPVCVFRNASSCW